MTATANTSGLRQFRDLAGPPARPLVGNALQVRRELIHQDVERWTHTYGPLFRANFGRMPILVVADHTLTADILRARPDDFSRSDRLTTVMREMGLRQGVFGAEGDAWRRQRRMVMASFAPHHVRAYFPSLVKVTQRLNLRWQGAARAGKAIDLQGDLMRFTVDAITGLAFGAEVNTLESDEDVIQRHLDKIFPALFARILALVPYWRVFKLPRDRDLDRSVAAVNDAIEGFVAQARARLQADPARRQSPPNLLEAMIVAADEPGSGVSDRDVAGNVLTMLLAGEDTTANSMAWMIDLLYRHPQALQRAQEEARRVVGDDPLAFTPELLDQLDYLEACTHETMRLKPVAPFLPVEAVRDVVIGDVQVPKGTLVWNVLRHDSVDEKYFEDAAAFKPERWLQEGSVAASATSSKRVAMPFGAGPRVCPARYLALLEIKMAMAMLLSRFDIVGVDTPDGQGAQEHMALTMEPVGMSMRLRAREPMARAA